MHINRVDQNKSASKQFGKSIHRRSQGLSKTFTALIYNAHRAVIFAIAQLSCIFTYSKKYLLGLQRWLDVWELSEWMRAVSMTNSHKRVTTYVSTLIGLGDLLLISNKESISIDRYHTSTQWLPPCSARYSLTVLALLQASPVFTICLALCMTECGLVAENQLRSLTCATVSWAAPGFWH